MRGADWTPRLKTLTVYDTGDVSVELAGSLLHLGQVLVLVVYLFKFASAGDVIDDPLGDVRGRTDLCMDGSKRSSEIVKGPVSDGRKLVKRGFALAPAVEWL